MTLHATLTLAACAIIASAAPKADDGHKSIRYWGGKNQCKAWGQDYDWKKGACVQRHDDDDYKWWHRVCKWEGGKFDWSGKDCHHGDRGGKDLYHHDKDDKDDDASGVVATVDNDNDDDGIFLFAPDLSSMHGAPEYR